MTTVLIAIGAVAFIALIAVLSLYYEKRRRDGLRAVANSMGFSFSEKDPGDVKRQLDRFHLFSQGRSRKIENVMRGSANETEVTIMDYCYTTGSGKSSQLHNQTVMCFRSDLMDLPDFALRPENIFHKIGGVFGLRDIDFDTHPGFSKHYLLRGSDEEAIRALFGDRLLTVCEERRGLAAEGAGDRLIFYRPSKRVSPGDVRSFMADGFEVFEFFKTRT